MTQVHCNFNTLSAISSAKFPRHAKSLWVLGYRSCSAQKIFAVLCYLVLWYKHCEHRVLPVQVICTTIHSISCVTRLYHVTSSQQDGECSGMLSQCHPQARVMLGRGSDS
jgi:hypothetical protein